VQKIKVRSLEYNNYMTLVQANSFLAQATALWGTHDRFFRQEINSHVHLGDVLCGHTTVH
jgi:hypothetical protein